MFAKIALWESKTAAGLLDRGGGTIYHEWKEVVNEWLAWGRHEAEKTYRYGSDQLALEPH